MRYFNNIFEYLLNKNIINTNKSFNELKGLIERTYESIQFNISFMNEDILTLFKQANSPRFFACTVLFTFLK